MKQQKILVAAPTYKGMRYCHRNFIDAITNFDIEQEYDILIIDNSNDKEYYNRLKTEPKIKAQYLPLKKLKGLQKIVRTRNNILQYALREGYTHLLMMDSDVIPPTNLLRELLKENKDIISGIYANTFNINGKQRLRPVAWKKVEEQEEQRILQNLSEEGKKKVLLHGGIRRFLTKEETENNTTQEVLIPSAGCMLITKNVFSKVRYGILPMSEGLQTSDDIYFCLEAQQKGFKAYINTRLQCHHLTKGKMIRKGNELQHPAYH